MSGSTFRTIPFTAWTATGDGIPLKPILSLYQRAVAAGVPVFFITGRAEVLRANTEKELRNAGFCEVGWAVHAAAWVSGAIR